jgi:hypothetical protein
LDKGKKERNRRLTYGSMFTIFGVILLLFLSFFSGSAVGRNKIDFGQGQVAYLFCTFKKVDFLAEDVVSNATGEKLTLLLITTEEGFWKDFTYNATQLDFVSVGFLQWTEGELLAFSKIRLAENASYVVDHGTIVTLYSYGDVHSTTPIVRIDSIHQRNWFEDLVEARPVEITFLMSLAVVALCSMFTLPFIEYHINVRVRDNISKRESRKKKSPTDQTQT